MIQEDKDLLLKDLSARLQYGVIVETPKGKGHVGDINLTIFGNNIGVNINPTIRDTFYIEDIQPYLFPLSSMTDEQLIIYGDLCYEVIHSLAWDTQTSLNELFDWLNKNHFDYRGLIEKGLAIDVTGLNVY